jgi:predicted acylesterase/phospholipase RssA
MEATDSVLSDNKPADISGVPKDLKIALAFSGGGYRAACFCLGTLSYLEKLKVKEKSLLNHVVALSTVSGGTITGAAYAIGLKKGEPFHAIYRSLYRFIKEADLVGLSLDRLISKEGWGEGRVKSLINAFADVYDKELFREETFGTILSDEPAVHLKHISFNATEFSNALQFRFQWSEKINNAETNEFARGIIGNNDFRISEDAAREIRMADILAASSCFPGGFEPINFPTDFIRPNSVNLRKLSKEEGYPVGLMDGGIVDNQGIEPILLAEKRMKRSRANTEQQGNELDLIIISDVASPYMEDYQASMQRPAKGWRRFTPGLLLLLNSLMLLASSGALYWFLNNNNIPMVIGSTVVVTLSLVFFVIGRILKALPGKFDVPVFFLKPLGKLLRLKLQVYETMITNRKNSVLKMVGEVFLKHVRRLNYRQLYHDDSWQNRRIMNAIYELKTGEEIIHKKIQKNTLPGYLMPSPKLQQAATLAASMGTTLWFSPDEIQKKNMLDTIIACGQFTFCWNLLEYIAIANRDKTNLTPAHNSILALEAELRSDWELFNKDPYWLMKKTNKESQTDSKATSQVS